MLRYINMPVEWHPWYFLRSVLLDFWGRQRRNKLLILLPLDRALRVSSLGLFFNHWKHLFGARQAGRWRRPRESVLFDRLRNKNLRGRSFFCYILLWHIVRQKVQLAIDIMILRVWSLRLHDSRIHKRKELLTTFLLCVGWCTLVKESFKALDFLLRSRISDKRSNYFTFLHVRLITNSRSVGGDWRAEFRLFSTSIDRIYISLLGAR